MSDARRGLPLTKSHREKIFPKLTPAQIDRIAAHGRMRSVQPGGVLIEQGDTLVPFFVVITGEVEIVRPFGAYETLVTVHLNKCTPIREIAKQAVLSFRDIRAI